MRTLIVAVVLTLAASTAGAGVETQEMRGVYGFGTLKCGYWVEAHDSGNNVIE